MPGKVIIIIDIKLQFHGMIIVIQISIFYAPRVLYKVADSLKLFKIETEIRKAATERNQELIKVY
jgi:hypothetical protein